MSKKSNNFNMSEIMDVFDDKADSSDEEDPVLDEDSCTQSEINELFKFNYYVTSEQSVSLKKNYILHLGATTSFDTVAAGLSDKSVQIYKIGENSLTRIFTNDSFGKHTKSICGVKFMNGDSNILFCGSQDGSISMLDMRSQEKIFSFEDTSDNKKKPITNFDINQNDRLLCAGTDQINSDVFLLFFDVRQRQLLGGYWESHTDDITQVKFHPTNPDVLASGSTDGLINVFDVSNSSEDDALQYCLNTESSVDRLNWHKNVYDKDLISCITHTNDLHLFNVEESESIVEFKRDLITERMKRISSMDCNLINCHNTEDGEVLILSASNFNRGECIRSLKVANKKLSPVGNFNGNRQIVRTSIYNPQKDLFLTSGESGIVSLWSTQQFNTDKITTPMLKDKMTSTPKNHKNAIHNKKPY